VALVLGIGGFSVLLPMECFTAMNFSHELSQGSGVGGQEAEDALCSSVMPSPQHPVAPSPLSLDRFCNDDPDILTLIVIGERSHVRAHILR
jgi:hypothetical protein